MSEIANLIHTGLPWSSPQKIAIHSSQYINNIVINRGLLSLLNNDYYLEVKTQAINNYIENNIKQHINDQNLHVSWKRISSLLTEISSETKDTVYFIPLYHNGKPVQFDVIENIFNMLPKNLNGHTVILCFCNAFESTFQGIKEIQKSINLETYGILINGFIGGDLIIYSTTDPNIIINDYNVLSQLRATESYTLTIFSKVQAAINSQNKFQTHIDGLTLIGNGLNKNYSVLSIKNCQASVYVVNIEITNNLNWNKLQEEKAKISYLPQKDDLLNFYTLTDYDNKKLLDKQIYLNKNYLYRNNDYSLNFINGKEEYIKKQSDSSSIMSSALQLNLSGYLKVNLSPQYLTFDNDSKLETLISEQLRSYIYNWNGETNCFTIAFWGNMIEDDNLIYTNSPIFSDYIVNEDKNFGLYVYANKIYRTAISDIKDSTEYYSDFQKYYADILNNWGLYVLQFIHDSSALESIKNEISVSAFHDISIGQNNMRINLLFYPLKDKQCRTLIPNSITVNNINNYTDEDKKRQYLQTVGYEIPKLTKQQFQKYIYSLKFFANKRLDNNFQSLKNWDYFSGKIRNLFFFKKILSKTQIQGILKLSPYHSEYHWLYANQSEIIKGIDLHSALAAVYSENNQNLNFIKTNIRLS